MKQLVAGTRGSKLAMAQTSSIIEALGLDIKIEKISTKGDKITDVALAKVQGKGFFTREIDEALLAGKIDFAVHSLKDLPVNLMDGLVIAAIPKRESARDALLGAYKNLSEIPKNAKVGTSSLRRRAEILRNRPDLEIVDLRGNVDTRIRKLNEGQYDAIIVAEAGLKRLGYNNYYPLPPDIFIPAVCQGALVITARRNDKEIINVMSILEDSLTRIVCEAERSFLNTLEVGCQIPAGAFSSINLKTNTYHICGFISSIDGKQFLRGEKSSLFDNAKNTAIRLAEELLNSGGNEILESISGD